MAYANGRLPASALGPIPGNNAGLRKDAAAAYRAMNAATGTSLAIYDGEVGRAYRSYARQVRAKQRYGRNAATPGYSNHGHGIAVDLMNRAQRYAIDQVGRAYGWSKAWSDASWEWWHLKWRPGVWRGQTTKPKPRKPVDPLTKDERRVANELLRLRQQHGKRWNKNERVKARRLKQELLSFRADIRRAAKKDGWSKNRRRRRYSLLLKIYKGEVQ